MSTPTTPSTPGPVVSYGNAEPSYPLEAIADYTEPAPEFLPLAGRRVLYVIALAATAIAPVLAVTQPEYATAILTSAGALNTAAIGTALANPSKR